jgi:Flp pilus assembly secretin CpaC
MAAASNPEVVSASPARTIDRAIELMDQGKLIQARHYLDAMIRSSKDQMSTEETTRVFGLLSSISTKLRALSPTEMSMQRAEAALVFGELREAELHAKAVMDSSKASEAEKASAKTVVEYVREHRAAQTPQLRQDLHAAVAAFEAGSYRDAHSKLARIGNIGLDLSPGERMLFDTYAKRLSDMALATGDVSLGSLPAMSDETTGWLLQDSGSQPTDPIAESNRNEAMRILAEADAAFNGSQFRLAQTKYNQLLAQYAQHLSETDRAHVERRATDVALRLNAQPGGEILGEVQEDIALQRDRARQIYRNQIDQAERALASGDFSTARLAVSQAGLTASQNSNVLPEDEVRGMLDGSSELVSRIEQAEEAARVADAEAIERELAADSARREDEVRAERERQISAAISRVRALQLELKYDEALQVVDQILSIDPLSPAGLLLKEVLEDARIYRIYHELQREKMLSYSQQSIMNEEAMLAPEAIIGYPSDWPNISFKRGEPMQFTESAANRAVLATLQDRRIPVNFANNRLADVLQFVEQVSNLNMDIDWASLELIGVDPETPVTLKLTSVTLETVLNRVLDKVSDPDIRAGWAVTDGILTIASDEVLRRNTVLEIYDIRDLLIDIPDYTEAPTFDLNSVLQGNQGGGGGQSPFQQTGQGNQGIDRRDRDEMIEEIIEIITSNVDSENWDVSGGETGSIREFNGNLIITNTPANHRAIITLLSKLREVRALQINVETRFLLVAQDFFEQIGFDIDVYLNADNNEFGIARTIDPSLLPSDYFDEQGRLLRRVGSGNFDLDGDGTIDGPGGFGEPGDFVPVFSPGLQGDEWSIIRGAQDSLSLTNTLAAGSAFAGDILGASPALGITGQFLDDIQVDFMLQATQADRRSVSLTAPRLTFTNGQTANIYVATQQAFVSDLTPVTSESAVAFDPEVDVVNSGVVLLIDGIVSADRRYVTLNVDAAISQLEDFARERVTAIAGGLLVDSEEDGSFIQLPIVSVSRVQTTVTIPDQGTILLGGQRLVTEVAVETGVPVLSKIPILSRFFSNRVDAKEEQTLLVLLKPTILIQNEQEEENFPGLLDALGR